MNTSTDRGSTGLVVDNIWINGTADILETGGCGAAGVMLTFWRSPSFVARE
jgi:hypothetical protein